MSVRTILERGPKGRKFAAVALDWPGWSRGAKAGFAHETSVAYGDELAVNAAIAPIDPGRPDDILGLVRGATAGRPLGDRARGHRDAGGPAPDGPAISAG